MPGATSAEPIFCQPKFMQNCIEDDMVRRNWQNIQGFSWKFEKKYESKVKILLKITNFEEFPPIFWNIHQCYNLKM